MYEHIVYVLPMTAFPAALLVVPAPEEEILVSSTFSELVYGFGGAGVLSFQEATDLLWRPLFPVSSPP